ncbi:MAG: hydantoinase B/oxoprolinase family protein [Streptosporangiales bacterium]|nr:hydantoinase B/oxoprolinase family protein [Streptosporangiales bacterium]
MDSGAQAVMTAKTIKSDYDLDLVTAETIRAGLIETTRHMRNNLVRSAFSNVVRDILDFGVAVHSVSDEGSEMAAITEGCCHFAFTHQHMTNMVLDEWGYQNLGPGDTLFCNDPWRGSIHFLDVNLFRPVFWKDEIAFVLTDATHITDIGGPVAGGFNAGATTHFEEGLRVPPTLITSAGKPVRSTINLLLENTRTPFENLGDLRALFGTLRVGEARLSALLERYGIDAVKAGARYSLDLAEKRMRRAIEAIPDGVWEGEEFIDDDAIGDDPIRLHASVRKVGDSVEVDYSGSDRQPLGALMTCWEETNRSLIGSKMILDPRHPMNAGAMRPFHVLAPAGSVVMGLPPASQSMHTEVAAHACNLMLSIFGRMGGEQAIAVESANTHVHVFGGIDSRPGREGTPWGQILAAGASWGGTNTNDGISFNITAIFNIADNTIELLERDNPVVVRGRNLLMDAAAAGKFRSGFANALMVECLGDAASSSHLLDSGRFVRDGLDGGGAGMTAYLYMINRQDDGSVRQRHGLVPMEDLEPLAGKVDETGAPDPEFGEWCRDTKFKTLKLTGNPIKKGDVVFIICSTGGGYGSPLERDPEAVRLDVWNEKVSIDFAKRAYGVDIDAETLTVDEVGTKMLREDLRGRESAGDWKPPVAGFRPWPQTWSELERL